MKPFIMVSTRPEIEAAEQEYESFRIDGGLATGDLHHVRLEEVDFLSGFQAGDVSGVFIGGSPYDVSSPEAAKTRTQLRVEEQVRELLSVALKEGVPVLATGFGLEVLARYLGTETSTRFAESLGSAEIYLTADGRQDPLLQGMPEVFTAFVGHHAGVGQVPAGATLLATSADCPVQMVRVGASVYGTQFNPELDVDLFLSRLSIYKDAGYGDPGLIDDLLNQARTSTSGHEAGRLIRSFVEHFSQD
ncbi:MULTISPECIES: glutamine amidotransferase-related protein [Actinomyces]|uniref:Glutamine amidotransferase domain-containing protein n=1 Tax=Actinomyces respiraculi TaxID=2744574 RepID=A0A7T0PW45_9ACTO|nr:MULTISPECIES: hypothetical protein [Actinomyces]QPL05364.1 hypothetical protein ID810_11785 [Actinomyces respiraculi]